MKAIQFLKTAPWIKGIANYYWTVLNKYAVFSGRAQRAEYWYFYLFNIVIIILLGIIDDRSFVLRGLYAWAVIIPYFAVIVRRLHDIGKSGWACLIILIPLAGPIWMLVWLVTDSEPGENKYGPNPKLIKTD